MAMQFIPNSPRPPRGTIFNFPVGMRTLDASTGVKQINYCDADSQIERPATAEIIRKAQEQMAKIPDLKPHTL
jgi:hypothetical protein